jgi:hypothetical protein
VGCWPKSFWNILIKWALAIQLDDWIITKADFDMQFAVGKVSWNFWWIISINKILIKVTLDNLIHKRWELIKKLR